MTRLDDGRLVVRDRGVEIDLALSAAGDTLHDRTVAFSSADSTIADPELIDAVTATEPARLSGRSPCPADYPPAIYAYRAIARFSERPTAASIERRITRRTES